MIKVQSLKVYVSLERMTTETDSNMGIENVNMPTSTFIPYIATPDLADVINTQLLPLDHLQSDSPDTSTSSTVDKECDFQASASET